MAEARGGYWNVWRAALLLAVAIFSAALIVNMSTMRNIATISRVPTHDVRFAIVAMLWTMLATIVPFWFERVISNGAALQLAVVVWRMGTLLPALAFATTLQGNARICFVSTLLVCYFVALPLESWLLALRARY